MSKSEDNREARLQAALTKIRRLLEYANRGPRPDDALFGTKVFADVVGGRRFAISGKDLSLFIECVDALSNVHVTRPDHRVLSREAAESRLKTIFMDVIVSNNGEDQDTRAKFEARLENTLAELQSTMLTAPNTWQVELLVQGVDPGTLPFQFGGVEFESSGGAVGKRFAERVKDFLPRPDDSSSSLNRTFAIGRVSVTAFDKTAAERLGIERIRQTLDVVNFFAAFVGDRPQDVCRSFVAPEGERTPIIAAAYRVDQDPPSGGLMSFREVTYSFQCSSLATERANKAGAPRADVLMAIPNRTEFEDQVVTALSWAGRATVEPRRDQRFVSCMIALEALLAQSKRQAGVTGRLQLRTAHLVSDDFETRRLAFKHMEKLYKRRSALVHAGASGDLTDGDIALLTDIVDAALVRVLTEEPFKSMKHATQFDDWIEQRILA